VNCMNDPRDGAGAGSTVDLLEFRLLEAAGARVAVHRRFEAESGARHAFSLKGPGGRSPGLDEARVAAQLEDCDPAVLKQAHGDALALRRREPGEGSGQASPTADGQTTREAAIALVIQSADCLPVLLGDTRSAAVGAAHAGWRGTALGVVSRLVERMAIEHGCDPARLVALLGPAIGPCCYEVGEDVASIFRRRFPAHQGFLRIAEEAGGGRMRLDLTGANAFLLARSGVPEGRIIRSGLCTVCRMDLFPSYRLQGREAGRMYSLIAPAGR